ncbi:hypothetical protein TRV_00399 [Trichophyton verrucosum HKI 0517]|uniref:Fumarylacetoacetase-like C-terminal domain-containing protein n=1 Tax=Trichophyton verrucosum (strain HKI 0517) TaxID=663202 RepID=D4D005_TRIVH|nr:uncharacterized protein TRV_00399 [Trichophyton verrucosum HKI 0517]EFE44848.1 hypothetical protein TRV_00399 [Trichophyton verrucosum HKI 0517]
MLLHVSMQFNELCRSLNVLVLRPAMSLLDFMGVDQSERICVILCTSASGSTCCPACPVEAPWKLGLASAIGSPQLQGVNEKAIRPAMASIRANCRKIVCIGRNYADHIAELNNSKPKQPFFFLKPPSSLLIPGAGPVLRPKGVKLHYEVELGLIMGSRLRDHDPKDVKGALDSIAGYVVAIDMTARNVQDSAKRAGLPWSIAKGFDTFSPISSLISKSAIPDPHNATLHLEVDGVSKQLDNTGLMIYKIPRQLADISRVMTLDPGDLVLTGTPKGVGEVTNGQVMTAGIRVDGKEIEEGRLKVMVKDREGRYEFAEN